MDINWNSLRSLNGSVNKAFEELCCQLAAYEPVPQGSKFIRLGTPDGGIEGYWVTPNSDEWGWQAKFFTRTPGSSQWDQLDDSVKTVLQKHPRLTVFIVCLPLDRADPRIGQQSWFMDKWNERIQEWGKWANQKGMTVEFIYWGEHEIWDRLSRNEHRGRYFFWFHRELFTDEWLGLRLDEAIANAGPRYTPELNVELPISRLFDGLGRTDAFFDRIEQTAFELKKSFSSSLPAYYETVLGDRYRQVEEHIQTLLESIKTQRNPVGPIALHNLTSYVHNIREAIKQCDSDLDIMRKQKIASSDSPDRSEVPRIDRGLYRIINALEDLFKSDETRLAMIGALLIEGDAGIGKTHLLCDVARQRLKAKAPTLLLLGEQFRNNEPWSQIISLLGLSCDREQFLGALNAAAEANGKRALIIIDALNEGDGKQIWYQYLSGILTVTSHYQWINITFSVRDGLKKEKTPGW